MKLQSPRGWQRDPVLGGKGAVEQLPLVFGFMLVLPLSCTLVSPETLCYPFEKPCHAQGLSVMPWASRRFYKV